MEKNELQIEKENKLGIMDKGVFISDQKKNYSKSYRSMKQFNFLDTGFLNFYQG